MIAPFPSTIFPCTVHCFPLQHVRTLSSRASCDSRPSSVLTHQHSAHEPTALCASDRASLDASSEARPPSLPNTRRTSLRLCAPLIELRSMCRAQLDHPHCPTLGARAYGSVRLGSSFARCVERSSTTLTAHHSAHEPTALCASGRLCQRYPHSRSRGGNAVF